MGMPTGHAVHTFYLVDSINGTNVDAGKAASTCINAGGIEHQALTEDNLPQDRPSLSEGQFYFSVPRQGLPIHSALGSPSSSLM